MYIWKQAPVKLRCDAPSLRKDKPHNRIPKESFWVGLDWEQESFTGPKMYKTVDGTFHEQVVLNFDTEHGVWFSR